MHENLMKKIISFCLALMLLSVLIVSCAKDEEAYVLSNDCYVSGVTLGYTKRMVHVTTQDGKDSTYYVSLNGQYYPMTVDQRNLLIYNEDSLPYGTQVSAMLATVSAAGYVAYRPAGDEEAQWLSYSATDSINFSTPLSVRVVSMDGTAFREYTLKVNVHRQDADDFTWKQMPAAEVLQGMEQMKSVCWRNRLFVWGYVNGAVKVAYKELVGTQEWTLANTVGCEGADITTLQVLGDRLYMNGMDGVVMTSTDGLTWATTGPETVECLVAVGARYVYALSDGRLYRSEDGRLWQQEKLDEASSFLPVQETASVCYTMPNGDERILLMGSRDRTVHTGDTSTVVWGKYWNRSWTEDAAGWMFFNVAPDNRYVCPCLKNLTLFRYDDLLIACGGESLDGKHAALDAFYVSVDNGITWKTDDVLLPPAALKGTRKPLAVAVDDEAFIWMVCGTDVWRGRLNRLGFEKK